MRTSYFSMWVMLGIMAFGAFGGTLIHGDVWRSIRAAFPSEQVKQEALRRCAQMDPQFSRFFEQDRKNCYRTIAPAGGQVSSNGAPASPE
jgi:hypothetical protein